MIRPEPLRKGDVIALIAPASCDVNRLDQAIVALNELGLQVKTFPSCYQSFGWMAGRDGVRAKDVMDAFTDKEVRGVFCLRGGCGSYRLLSLLDYQVLKENKKTFVGYSDITALHSVLNERADMMTYHAPMPATDMIDLKDQYTKEYFERMIFSKDPQGEIFNPREFPLEFMNNLETEGVLMGGNLSLIVHLLGTPYEPDFKDKILFLEDIGENFEQLERKFYHLKLAGKLDQAAGFIIGQFTNSLQVSEPSFTFVEMLANNFPKDKPLVYNFQCGHEKPTASLILGSRVKIDSGEKKIWML